MSTTQTATFSIVAVANEPVDPQQVAAIAERHAAGRRVEVLVVAPALNSAWRHWCSDDRLAVADASDRLERSLARLHAAGIDADGWVGDAHPMTALHDALAGYGADYILLSVQHDTQTNWLARDLQERVQRLEIPCARTMPEPRHGERAPARAHAQATAPQRVRKPLARQRFAGTAAA